MLKIYGLKNCDTCRAVRKWLTSKDVAHEFLDLRDTPLDTATLNHWIAEAGLDILLNKRGTTWRKLDAADKDNLSTEAAVQLMLAHPALIKRPVFSKDGKISIGFAKDEAGRSHLL